MALAMMVAVFSTTGGLSGAEIGIAGGASALAQKLLEAVFGEDGVRRMSDIALEKLNHRVNGLMADEKARFLSRLDVLDLDPGLPARLEAVALQIQKARNAEDADAVLPAAPPVPGSRRRRRTGARRCGIGGTADDEGSARPAQPPACGPTDARRRVCPGPRAGRSSGSGRPRRGPVPPSALQEARSVAERAEARRGLSEQITVVAFAGSTGAGKSTLFNSILGEVAKAGVLRPTTSEPLAAIWQESRRRWRC